MAYEWLANEKIDIPEEEVKDFTIEGWLKERVVQLNAWKRIAMLLPDTKLQRRVLRSFNEALRMCSWQMDGVVAEPVFPKPGSAEGKRLAARAEEVSVDLLGWVRELKMEVGREVVWLANMMVAKLGGKDAITGRLRKGTRQERKPYQRCIRITQDHEYYLAHILGVPGESTRALDARPVTERKEYFKKERQQWDEWNRQVAREVALEIEEENKNPFDEEE